MLISDNINDASRFLASTLHEIRTPIQTIIGTIELISETHLDKEQTEYIRQIQFSAEVLLDLANNILDFTKIRSNEFQLESIPFDISHVTEQVVNLISIEAFNKGVEVVIDIADDMPKFVTGDSVRVQQIMLNLVKNAVKFTNSGYIHIELAYENNSVSFKVTDSGVGISPDKQKKLFTDYFQADISTYRKFGGTGLGLSICKNLVSVMNGTIGVKSNPYGGSIFFFSIPLPISDPELSFTIDVTEKEISETAKSKNILIVDDNVLAVNSLRHKLNRFGIKEIECAATAEDAIELIKFSQRIKKPFDSVFINLRLSTMDGWHLASEIKGNEEIIKNFKMYLLVPEGQMKGEAKMKLLNWFNGYLYKPVKRKNLRELFSDETEIKELPKIEDNLLKPDGIIEIPEQKFDIKVLVAEDHPVNRKLIEAFLKSFGLEVYLAEDGLQAIEQIKAHPEISLIFMDIFMPNKSGVEATEDLRKQGYEGIIIACTANNDSGDFADYIKIGINDIIVKPFKKAAIKSAIEKWHSIIQIPETRGLMNIETINTINAINQHEKEIWDYKDFLQTVDNDKEFAEKLIRDFIEQTNNFIEKINAIVTSQTGLDLETLHRLAHTIKGSSAAVSASHLFEAAKELDETAKAAMEGNLPKKFETEKLQEAFLEFKKYSAQVFKSGAL